MPPEQEQIFNMGVIESLPTVSAYTVDRTHFDKLPIYQITKEIVTIFPNNQPFPIFSQSKCLLYLCSLSNKIHKYSVFSHFRLFHYLSWHLNPKVYWTNDHLQRVPFLFLFHSIHIFYDFHFFIKRFRAWLSISISSQNLMSNK